MRRKGPCAACTIALHLGLNASFSETSASFKCKYSPEAACFRTHARLQPGLEQAYSRAALNRDYFYYYYILIQIFILQTMPAIRKKKITRKPNKWAFCFSFLVRCFSIPLQPLYMHMYNFFTAGLLPSAILHSALYH